MKKKLLAIAFILLPLASGAFYYLGYIPVGESTEAETNSEHAEVDSHGNPVSASSGLYLPLDPPFVINFSHLGLLRYLQISLVVSYPDQKVLDKVTMNMPAIRNALILLLSNQEFDRLNSLVGKQQIREEMIATIDQLVLAEAGTGSIFYTNFVMQ